MTPTSPLPATAVGAAHPATLDVRAGTRPHRTRGVHRAAVVLLALLISAVGALLTATTSAAQEAGPSTWAISPADPEGGDVRSAIQRVVEPGEVLVEHVLVENLGEVPLSLDLYAADALLDDAGFDLRSREEPSTAVGAWVVPDLPQLTLEPRSGVVVPLTITVPANAEPGDHAGGIVASRTDTGTDGDLGVDTERRVGTRVHLRVAGPIRPAVEVQDLTATYRHEVDPLGRGRVELSYRLVNTGNIRLDGHVVASVAGPFGLLSSGADGPPAEDLLPGQQLTQTLAVEDVWPLVRLGVDVRFEPTGSVGQPLEAEEPRVATTALWALPVELAVLVVVLAGATWLVRRRRRRGGDRSNPGGVIPGGDPPPRASDADRGVAAPTSPSTT